MKRRIIQGVFAIGTLGTLNAGAVDSVPGMRGADAGLRDLTAAILDGCTDLKSYPTDNDPAKAGNQPIVYSGLGSDDGESAMKTSSSAQWVAPMTRALGTGICSGSAPRAGAEGIVVALDFVQIVVAPGAAGAEGIDYTGAAGDLNNDWRTVLREVYTGMGATGKNVRTRDCNSPARHALVDNWDNLFHGSTGATCSDSNPDDGAANVEPGLRHAFRPNEQSGLTDVFLAQLALPTVVQQVNPIWSNVPIIPSGSNSTQVAVYSALSGSPFCNVRRPDDKNPPVSKGGSFIPPMYQIGLPSGTTPVGSQGLMPYDPALGDNARFLSPYMPEMHDQDPIRRKCFGPKVSLADAPNAPREEVCSADGSLGLVLPVSPPPSITTAARYPSLPCEETRDFEFGPAPTRPTGDPVRCPNGDVPQDGRCLLPTRTSGTGFAFDCLNTGLLAPAAIFDSDGDGHDYPDALTTDGRADVDGRVYNLTLRATDGSIRSVTRPTPVGIVTPTGTGGSMNVPIVGAYYRIHSSRSGLLAPNHTKTCATQDDPSDQLNCLVNLNPCSMGFVGPNSVSSSLPNLGVPVDGVPVTIANVQALVAGGVRYPLSRKVYLNTIRGFENLLTSNDPSGVLGKDAELDFAECYANLPFSTAVSVGTPINVAAPFGLVPLPGNPPKALCEDFNGTVCGDASNADACENNTGLIPASACNNGLIDGDETGVDVCPAARPTCDATLHHCR